MRKTTEKWTVERTEEIDPQLIKEQIDKELPEKIKPLEDRVEALEKKAPTDLSEVESRLTAVEVEDKELKVDINRVETKVNSTETQIAATKKNSDKNTADLIKTNQKIASLESKNAITDAKIKNLENRATSIEGKVTRIEESAAKEKTRLDKVESNIKDMLIELDRLRQQQGGTAPEPQEVFAFPKAYGAGANVVGGRGQTVYHVTNLNNSGAGSFRDALSQGDRTIVFDVSGVIILDSFIPVIDLNNITIAGQTAPEGGITIDGDMVYFENVQQLIVRHIRFKGGVSSTNYNGGATNSFQAKLGIQNQIFDHVTFAFGFFQGGSWYETNGTRPINNVTVQRCLFAENDRGALSGTESGTAVPVGAYSFISNAFFNVSHRTPNAGGDGARIDLVNNIVWYIGNRFSQIDGSLKLNHIGNYYNYNNTPANDYRMQMFQSEDTNLPEIYTGDNLYVANNTQAPLTSSITQINTDNRLSFKHFVGSSGGSQGDQLQFDHFVAAPHILNGRSFTPLTGAQALIDVSNDVGCNARLNADGTVSENLDTLDTGYLNNIKNNVYTVSRRPSNEWIVPPISSISRPGGFYGINQHIPQAFLTAKGITNTLTVHNELSPSGYTWLEEYLNQVDN